MMPSISRSRVLQGADQQEGLQLFRTSASDFARWHLAREHSRNSASWLAFSSSMLFALT